MQINAGMIDALSLDEMLKVRKMIDAGIKTREEEKKEEVKELIRAKAAELGLDPRQLVKEMTPSKSSKKAGANTRPPKYQHPTDPSITWSGYSRRPEWIHEYVASGKDIEELRIPGS